MNLTIQDKRSQKIMSGLFLLFKTYPNGVISVHDDSINFVIPHTDKNLTDEECEQLEEDGWEYGEPHYLKRCSWWDFSMT